MSKNIEKFELRISYLYNLKENIKRKGLLPGFNYVILYLYIIK